MLLYYIPNADIILFFSWHRPYVEVKIQSTKRPDYITLCSIRLGMWDVVLKLGMCEVVLLL